ncbi:MAG: 1-acyl-sn-glycerol-3-phosphate acyltransferase [Planctomycetes bacterium]|nr:1-acyl-sn-glycerol-3-phosphate acyltransferase [Planctomycetota bacterium]
MDDSETAPSGGTNACGDADAKTAAATSLSKSAPPSVPPRIPYVYRGEGSGWLQIFYWTVGKVFVQFFSVLCFHIRVSGRENIPSTGAALLVSNHQSMLDPWMIGIGMKRQIHFMARESLFKGGLGQYIIETTNAFPVRRGRADSVAVREAINRLNRGFLVNLFPEATRTTDGTIGAIAAGVAIIVHRAKVPVIPIVLDGAFEAWPRDRKFFRYSSIRLHYGQPIPYHELENLSADEISVRIRREMIALQKKLKSVHAAASEARLADDLQAGKKRLVVSREFSA